MSIKMAPILITYKVSIICAFWARHWWRIMLLIMSYNIGRYNILKKQNIAKNIYRFEIECPKIAREAEPGQFVHAKAKGSFLRRPISICETTKDTLTIVFEIRGEGTLKLSELKQGENLDIMAPLGKGFSLLEKDKKVVVVGGGIGVPPLLGVAKENGENTTAIIGFKTATSVILKEDFKKAGAHTTVCTDDGTMGVKGFVTEALEKHLVTNNPDMIYTCGPLSMIKRVVDISKQYNVRCEVSLEQRMACGVGACLVCACKTCIDNKVSYSHVCKEGPVFPAEQVVF